jgi:hypothetical protein
MPTETYDKRGDCCRRRPLEGEAIHADLASDPDADHLWQQQIGFRVEAMRELAFIDCPEDLTQTLYYRVERQHWTGEGAFLSYLRDKQRVGRLVRDTGYEETGWPVVRRTVNGRLSLVDGTHRLATMRALGRPVAAILIERPDYKNNRLAEAKALQ